MEHLWSVQMLGRFRLTQGERTISRFRTLKAAGILAYLAYHRHHSQPRETLIELYWPEAEIDSARHSLSLALSSLRNQLEPPGVPAGTVIVADRQSVELNPEAFTTDVLAFEHALRLAAQASDDAGKARHLTDAVAQYRGMLLPGYYEEWVLHEQTRLGERYVLAVHQLVALLAKQGETAQALDLARRAVTVDPLREDLHAELIRLLAGIGQPAAALAQYRDLERLLDQELALRPSAALVRLARQLEQQDLPVGGGGAFVVPSPRATPPVREAPALPTGTVTFLLTDIEGSTARWEREGESFRAALALHHTLLRREFPRHGGVEVKEAGDSFVVAFASAGDALACAVAGQRALRMQAWPGGVTAPRVRMALHAGDVELEGGEYRGLLLHRAARILAAAHGGQILVSEAIFALLRRDLETEVRLRDLGVYRLRDVDVPERLFQVECPGLEPARFPPLRAERAQRGNLPLQVTRFFGREPEIEQLAYWLAPPATEAQLITLSGPGGTGKTRLALETARRLMEAYAGAVWFVPLADLTDPHLIPEAILRVLPGEAATDAPALSQVVQVLARQPSLLILDNFEQLLGGPAAESAGAEVVQALLEQTPALVVLVTSRQVLNLPGEREFPVHPLPTPGDPGGAAVLSTSTTPARGDGPEEPITAESLTLYGSVRLFIDRAQAVKPDFQVTNRNAPAVAELCRQLEGIPLALELAAARAQVLTPAQMLQQLSDAGSGRFDLLVSRRRGVPERQRALRSTIDWSYRLLAPALQRFFGRLSVCRGGWSVAAAEAVGDEPLALDYLAQLRECSLVQTEEGDDGIRFRMLETLREYAAEQLGREEHEGAARRHSAYFLALAEEAEPELRGAAPAAWLDRLERDHENLRIALERALEHGDSEGLGAALRLVNALWYFWSIRGYLAEGRRILARVLSAVPAEHPTLGRTPWRGKALTAAGALAHDQSAYAEAAALLQASVALWRELSTVPSTVADSGRAYALLCLANVRLDEGKADDALPLYQEALGLYRQVGDARGAAMALSNLGVLHLERGEVDRTATLLEESLRLKRQLGNPYGLAMSLESLGNLERSRGNPERALELCREALALRRELGHRLGIAMSLNNLGHLLLETGDPTGAARHLWESLEIFRELEEPRGAIEALTGLAGVMAALGQHERAARVLAAMDAQREAQSFEPRPCEKVVVKRWWGEVRAALDPVRLEALAREGRALSFAAAMQIARSEID